MEPDEIANYPALTEVGICAARDWSGCKPLIHSWKTESELTHRGATTEPSGK